MKSLLLVFTLAFAITLNAQKSENENVKTTVIDFFEAFHKQDTTALKSFVSDNVILQSISINKEGKSVLKEDKFDIFIKNIASIPKDRSFEEKLLDFNIQTDGNMANIWVSYEFWYQEKFSHCGVNSFQLMKEGDKWKIIYLVDTRRRDCE
ncbi:nuclear transport factor 2 family protein [Winogradskyella sp. R77965]|uniref:nuclear transport factor 2 family protein n=1 Tax=Winogradskyella sp. R77965 TaxID=3093872 RepID=UPI0037DC1B7C